MLRAAKVLGRHIKPAQGRIVYWPTAGQLTPHRFNQCPSAQPKPTAQLRPAMGDIVDLTFSESDDDSPIKPPEDEQEQQRKRIMDFAMNKAAAAKRPRPSSPIALAADADQPAAHGTPAKKTAAAAVEDPQSPAAAGTSSSPEAGAAAAPAAAAARAPDGFGNADLRALHEARMRRQQPQAGSGSGAAASGSGQQQQGKQSSQHEAGDSPAAAAAAAGGSSAARRRSRSPPAARPNSSLAGPAGGAAAEKVAGRAPAGQNGSNSISLLTYNVWFKEEVAVLERMIGLADIVRHAGLPTFICLQEVTPLILQILSNMDWWEEYCCSPHPIDMTYFTLLLVKKSAVPSISAAAFKEQPFRNSAMARGLRSVTASIGGHSLLVATSHLESPIPPQNFYSRERQQQMAEVLQGLDAGPAGNVLFAGDMNWEDQRDGSPPLPGSWCDAWRALQPGKPGLTYDAKNNPMLPYKGLALRLDRVLCKLSDWRLSSIQMVGTQPLPGIKYTHTFRNGGSKELPVLPSDHFGLLLRLEEV